jgi:hypothetical protein
LFDVCGGVSRGVIIICYLSGVLSYNMPLKILM